MPETDRRLWTRFLAVASRQLNAAESIARYTGGTVAAIRITTWLDWYRLARDTLGYGHAEAAAYADVRFTEDMQRKAQGLSRG